MSSRSTYEAVAAKLAWSLAFADTCPTEGERACARAAVGSAIHGIAEAFEAENPRFDRARFVGAATAALPKSSL